MDYVSGGDDSSAGIEVLALPPETEVSLDSSNNLVITDINGGTSDDTLTV